MENTAFDRRNIHRTNIHCRRLSSEPTCMGHSPERLVQRTETRVHL